jgi:hypothetical protein
MTVDQIEYEYVEYGVMLTSGGLRGALMTREWCEAHEMPFEPLYRRVQVSVGSAHDDQT